jgi:hypothetical protein
LRSRGIPGRLLIILITHLILHPVIDVIELPFDLACGLENRDDKIKYQLENQVDEKAIK